VASPIAQNPSVTFPSLIDQFAKRVGSRTALECGATHLSYLELWERMNHYARWAQSQQLGPGDVVCLLMENCVDYPAVWLGITYAGAAVSLVNCHLKGEPLRHSIELVHPRSIIVSSSLYSNLTSLRGGFISTTAIWVHGDNIPNRLRIDSDLGHEGRMGPLRQRPTILDTALYIYTSGTTGLPKAARVSHFRIMQWSHWFAGLLGIAQTDRLYNCLPMYHSAGGVVGTCAPFVAGGSVVIRPRFSASEFWNDIVEYDCTLFQYIGELCRYLLASPQHPQETSHRLRLCCGNGLSGAIWKDFQDRFRIPRIVEFYAATEGTLSLYNCEGKPGAIGHIPLFLAHRFATELVKFDVDSGLPLRGADSFCVRADIGEAGHAICRIGEPAPGSFEGYSDSTETESKILRSAFAEGDTWYMSGDVMRKDRRGFYYFVDRVGDTFRWKGENVSTAEVADVIAHCPGISEAVVFGVSVPHTDGRAGMAAVIPDQHFDLGEFHHAIAERLPAFARPIFLRVLPAIELTGTFKPQKQRLKEQGYDPKLIPDPLYFEDSGVFVSLDASLFERIQSGAVQM
jgi:fatty-acyl-CoA synthase